LLKGRCNSRKGINTLQITIKTSQDTRSAGVSSLRVRSRVTPFQ